MREMKNSEFKWLGTIPNAWTVCRLKDIKSNRKYAIVDGPFGSAISTNDYVDEGVPLIRITNLVNGNVSSDSMVYITEEHAETVQRSRVWLNDIVFAKTGATIGKCAINRTIEYGILASSCVKVSINEEDSVAYFYYLFSTNQFVEAIKNACIGTTRDTINLTPFSNISVVKPTYEEQQKIAKLLDEKCSLVDSLIANHRAQIEKLKAYKQSLITEVVTKGLDSTIPMKDSGVEYIGDIPENWNAVPINSLFEIKKDIIGRDPDCVLSITQQGLKIKDITVNEGQMSANYDKYQIVKVGDFAMNHMDLLTGGVGISEYDGVTSPDYRVFVLRDNAMNAKFFLYIFQMYYKNKIFYAFGQGAANVGRWRLPAQNFKTTQIPLAPVEEQNAIVEYLDSKLESVDKLISIKEHKINKLNQYKKSLIYEYVTGKKEA